MSRRQDKAQSPSVSSGGTRRARHSAHAVGKSNYSTSGSILRELACEAKPGERLKVVSMRELRDLGKGTKQRRSKNRRSGVRGKRNGNKGDRSYEDPGHLQIKTMRELRALDVKGAAEQRTQDEAKAHSIKMTDYEKNLFKCVMDEDASAIVKLLKDEPGLLDSVNTQGQTARVLAKERGKWRAAHVLEAAASERDKRSSFKESGRHTRRRAVTDPAAVRGCARMISTPSDKLCE